ncbi:hypothetical protein BV20DRAFT_536606 [Pilatotrama ljubarskyi]|nr:hypothetical protein BV20DRAFT_536606 [Pilatotrama ljubarskyi]
MPDAWLEYATCGGRYGTVHPPNAFDQLVQSLLAAQHQQQQQQQHQREHERHAPASVSSGHQASRVPVDPSASSATAAPMPELSATDESTQAFLDNWLEMLTTFPPGDPNDASIGTGSATTAAATSSSTSTSPDIGPQSAQDSSSPKMAKSSGGAPQISDDLIDPALLGMHVDIPTDSAVAEASASRSTGEQSHAVPAPPVALDVRTAAAAPSGDNATSSTTVQPATPSLVDSPSVTVSSLADPAERDAEGGGDGGTAMPLWDWAFQDVQETTAEGMKMLEELAGMDVDVDLDAVMGVEMDMGGWEEVLGTSTALEESGQTSAQPSEGTQPRPKAQGNATRDEANGTTSAQTSTEPHQPPADASLLQSQPENEAGPPAIIPPAAFEAQTPFSNSSPVESQGVSAVPTEPPPPPSLLPPQASCFPLPPPPVTPPQITSAPPARAKGKAKAIPGSGPATLGLGLGRGRGKQDKRAIVERARAMREALEKEVERAKVALWETTLEQGVLVGLGRELDKGG